MKSIIFLAVGISFSSTAVAQVSSKSDFKNKYYSWEKGSYEDCTPKKGTPLASLTREPYKCYLDLEDCKASLDVATGKAPKAFDQLFLDLLVTVPSKSKGPAFDYTSCNRSNLEYVHGLGIQGIGYGRSAAHLPVLKKFVDSFGGSVGHATRSQLAQAVFLIGDAKQGAPILQNLLKLPAKTKHFKAEILEYLKVWNSDLGLDFCRENLKSAKPDNLMKACVSYLGARKDKSSYTLLVRRMEKMEPEVIRAFGQLGEKKAIAQIEEYMKSKDGNELLRSPALVALINLGKKKYIKEFLVVLEGKPVLSAKEKEKAKKKAARMKKRKKKKKKKNKEVRIDENQIRVASMEAVLLTNKGALKKIQKALKGIAKKGGDKWETAVYANIALAQMGDKGATKKLVSYLGSPKEKTRMAVVDTVGGRFSVVGSNWKNRGTGIVSSTSLVSPLSDMYGLESKKAAKQKIVRAIGYIQAISK